MRSTLLIALAAGVSAVTPPGFKPASSATLITAVYGSTVAINGTDVAQKDTASPPKIYMSTPIQGNYILMMVDPDVPGSSPTEYLQWLQPYSSVATEHTKVGEKHLYQLLGDSGAISSYQQPNPPFKVPYSHEYVLILLNSTEIDGIGDETLSADAQTRTNFDAAKTIKDSGLPIVGSNWFNVTNAEAISSGSATVSSASSTSSSSSKSSSSSSSSSSTGSSSSSATTTSSGATAASGSGTSTSSSSTSTSTGNAGSMVRLDAAVGVGLGAVAFVAGLV